MDGSRAPAALAEIRALELEMARRLDDARARAEATVAEARQRARRVVADARDRGEASAAAHQRERLTAATAEAERIREAGDAEAAAVLASLRPRLQAVVDAMVDVVLATSNDGGP